MPINKSNYLTRFEALKLQIGKDFDQLNFIHPSVKDVLTTPNGAPNDGDRYIVEEYGSTGKGENGTYGDFSSCPKNYIAEYDSRLKTWVFFKPYIGMEVIDRDSRYLKMYNGSAWENVMNFSVVSEGVNGNAALADEAVKLKVSKNFSISKGVKATGVSFNGESDVNLQAIVDYGYDYDNDTGTSTQNLPGVLPKKYGGTGRTDGKAAGLDHNIRINLNGIFYANDNTNVTDFTSDENDPYEIIVTNLNLPTQEKIDNDLYPYDIDGQLPTSNGGTGRTDGKALGLYPPVNLRLTYNDGNIVRVWGELNPNNNDSNNKIGNGNSTNTGDGTCSINLSKLPVELHYTPSSSDGTTYRRVAIDSKGHVITSGSSSSQYTKTSSFKIFNGTYTSFIGICHQSNSNKYYSYYIKTPFNIFNDNNIYIESNDSSYINLGFNMILKREYMDNYNNQFGNQVSQFPYLPEFDYKFDVLLSNSSTALTTSNISNIEETYYHLIGSNSFGLNNCGINISDISPNCGWNMYDSNGDNINSYYRYGHYIANFNYNKNITNLKGIISNINFSSNVYAIFKISSAISLPLNNDNYNNNNTFEINSDSFNGKFMVYTPRIDFEYNSK